MRLSIKTNINPPDYKRHKWKFINSYIKSASPELLNIVGEFLVRRIDSYLLTNSITSKLKGRFYYEIKNNKQVHIKTDPHTETFAVFLDRGYENHLVPTEWLIKHEHHPKGDDYDSSYNPPSFIMDFEGVEFTKKSINDLKPYFKRKYKKVIIKKIREVLLE